MSVLNATDGGGVEDPIEAVLSVNVDVTASGKVMVTGVLVVCMWSVCCSVVVAVVVDPRSVVESRRGS